MSESDRAVVRFICTDEGKHPARELGRWTLDGEGLARRADLVDVGDGAAAELFMRSSHRNARYAERVKAQGAARALATFDEQCPRCRRQLDQISAERFARVIAGLLALGQTEFDVSRIDMNRISH